MSIISNAKEIADLVKKLGNVDLYRRIVDLESEIIELSAENHSLNLRYMRQFYLMFPIRHALRDESTAEGKRSAPVSGPGIRHAAGDESPGLRPELSWTHYRLLLGVEDRAAREWYMHEAAGQ